MFVRIETLLHRGVRQPNFTPFQCPLQPNFKPFVCPLQPDIIIFWCPRQLLIEYILPAVPEPLEQLSGTPKWSKIWLSGTPKRNKIWLSGFSKWSKI